MSYMIDRSGQQYGTWTILNRWRRVQLKSRSIIKWECQCVCGRTKWLYGCYLPSGLSKQCNECFYAKVRVPEPTLRPNGLRIWSHRRQRTGTQGYVAVSLRIPGTNKYAWVAVHILVMEDHLDRRLTKGETVHHKNGVRDDNRLENLEIWSTRQPRGQRVEDKVHFAVEILRTYKPNYLSVEASNA